MWKRFYSWVKLKPDGKTSGCSLLIQWEELSGWYDDDFKDWRTEDV